MVLLDLRANSRQSGAGLFGVLSVLVGPDLTKDTRRFNITKGAIATATDISASLSMVISGLISNKLATIWRFSRSQPWHGRAPGLLDVDARDRTCYWKRRSGARQLAQRGGG